MKVRKTKKGEKGQGEGGELQEDCTSYSGAGKAAGLGPQCLCVYEGGEGVLIFILHVRM